MKNILIIMCLISTIILTGCVKKNEVDITNNQIQNENESISSESGEIQDDLILETLYSANVRIPKILINSEDARIINKELEDMAKEELKTWGKEAHNINYKYSKGEKVLSILVSQETEDGAIINYYTYNLDITTGERLMNMQIIEEEKAKVLLEKLPEIYGKEFDKYFDSISEHEKELYGEEIDFYREYTISTAPKSIEEIKYYLDENEGPQMITRIETITGAGRTYLITNLNEYIK